MPMSLCLAPRCLPGTSSRARHRLPRSTPATSRGIGVFDKVGAEDSCKCDIEPSVNPYAFSDGRTLMRLIFQDASWSICLR